MSKKTHNKAEARQASEAKESEAKSLDAAAAAGAGEPKCPGEGCEGCEECTEPEYEMDEYCFVVAEGCEICCTLRGSIKAGDSIQASDLHKDPEVADAAMREHYKTGTVIDAG